MKQKPIVLNGKALTPTEADNCHYLLLAYSQKMIAAIRHRSVNTIKNEMHITYRTHGVQSHDELLKLIRDDEKVYRQILNHQPGQTNKKHDKKDSH